MNFPLLFATALIPLIVGFIYYHPKVFGTAWMKENNFTEDDMKGANMAKIFGFTYFFSILITMTVQFIVIHQWSVYSIFANDMNNPEIKSYLDDFMAKYGNNFRTFKHGALHGFLSSIFYVMPLIGINAMFERKSFKYIFIHTGFWAICLLIMGGIMCQWG